MMVEFVVINDVMHLKIDGEFDDDALFSYNQTLHGKAEIKRQWDEYDRRGRPFMSYQDPTVEVVLPG